MAKHMLREVFLAIDAGNGDRLITKEVFYEHLGRRWVNVTDYGLGEGRKRAKGWATDVAKSDERLRGFMESAQAQHFHWTVEIGGSPGCRSQSTSLPARERGRCSPCAMPRRASAALRFVLGSGRIGAPGMMPNSRSMCRSICAASRSSHGATTFADCGQARTICNSTPLWRTSGRKWALKLGGPGWSGSACE